MPKNKIFLIPLLFLLALPISLGYGWGNQTLVINAQIICAQFSDCVNLKCMDEAGEGASYPSSVALDFGRMDYYRECAATQENWCFAKDDSCQDCTAGQVTNNLPIDAMNFYLNMAKGASGCEKYREMGKALNYFLQSKEYWHQVKGEKSECAENFEESVETYFKNSQINGWTAKSCMKLVAGGDFEDFRAEFIDIAKSELGIQTVSRSISGSSNQPAEQIVQPSNDDCLLENVKYVSPFCSGSRKVESAMSKWKDPFSTLLLIFAVYFIYTQFIKR